MSHTVAMLYHDAEFAYIGGLNVSSSENDIEHSENHGYVNNTHGSTFIKGVYLSANESFTAIHWSTGEIQCFFRNITDTPQLLYHILPHTCFPCSSVISAVTDHSVKEQIEATSTAAPSDSVAPTINLSDSGDKKISGSIYMTSVVSIAWLQCETSTSTVPVLGLLHLKKGECVETLITLILFCAQKSEREPCNCKRVVASWDYTKAQHTTFPAATTKATHTPESRDNCLTSAITLTESFVKSLTTPSLLSHVSESIATAPRAPQITLIEFSSPKVVLESGFCLHLPSPLDSYWMMYEQNRQRAEPFIPNAFPKTQQTNSETAPTTLWTHCSDVANENNHNIFVCDAQMVAGWVFALIKLKASDLAYRTTDYNNGTSSETASWYLGLWHSLSGLLIAVIPLFINSNYNVKKTLHTNDDYPMVFLPNMMDTTKHSFAISSDLRHIVFYYEENVYIMDIHEYFSTLFRLSWCHHIRSPFFQKHSDEIGWKIIGHRYFERLYYIRDCMSMRYAENSIFHCCLTQPAFSHQSGTWPRYPKTKVSLPPVFSCLDIPSPAMVSRIASVVSGNETYCTSSFPLWTHLFLPSTVSVFLNTINFIRCSTLQQCETLVRTWMQPTQIGHAGRLLHFCIPGFNIRNITSHNSDKDVEDYCNFCIRRENDQPIASPSILMSYNSNNVICQGQLPLNLGAHFGINAELLQHPPFYMHPIVILKTLTTRLQEWYQTLKIIDFKAPYIWCKCDSLTNNYKKSSSSPNVDRKISEKALVVFKFRQINHSNCLILCVYQMTHIPLSFKSSIHHKESTQLIPLQTPTILVNPYRPLFLCYTFVKSDSNTRDNTSRETPTENNHQPHLSIVRLLSSSLTEMFELLVRHRLHNIACSVALHNRVSLKKLVTIELYNGFMQKDLRRLQRALNGVRRQLYHSKNILTTCWALHLTYITFLALLGSPVPKFECRPLFTNSIETFTDENCDIIEDTEGNQEQNGTSGLMQFDVKGLSSMLQTPGCATHDSCNNLWEWVDEFNVDRLLETFTNVITKEGLRRFHRPLIFALILFICSTLKFYTVESEDFGVENLVFKESEDAQKNDNADIQCMLESKTLKPHFTSPTSSSMFSRWYYSDDRHMAYNAGTQQFYERCKLKLHHNNYNYSTLQRFSTRILFLLRILLSQSSLALETEFQHYSCKQDESKGSSKTNYLELNFSEAISRCFSLKQIQQRRSFDMGRRNTSNASPPANEYRLFSYGTNVDKNFLDSTAGAAGAAIADLRDQKNHELTVNRISSETCFTALSAGHISSLLVHLNSQRKRHENSRANNMLNLGRTNAVFLLDVRIGGARQAVNALYSGRPTAHLEAFKIIRNLGCSFTTFCLAVLMGTTRRQLRKYLQRYLQALCALTAQDKHILNIINYLEEEYSSPCYLTEYNSYWTTLYTGTYPKKETASSAPSSLNEAICNGDSCWPVGGSSGACIRDVWSWIFFQPTPTPSSMAILDKLKYKKHISCFSQKSPPTSYEQCLWKHFCDRAGKSHNTRGDTATTYSRHFPNKPRHAYLTLSENSIVSPWIPSIPLGLFGLPVEAISCYEQLIVSVTPFIDDDLNEVQLYRIGESTVNGSNIPAELDNPQVTAESVIFWKKLATGDIEDLTAERYKTITEFETCGPLTMASLQTNASFFPSSLHLHPLNYQKKLSNYGDSWVSETKDKLSFISKVSLVNSQKISTDETSFSPRQKISVVPQTNTLKGRFKHTSTNSYYLLPGYMQLAACWVKEWSFVDTVRVLLSRQDVILCIDNVFEIMLCNSGNNNQPAATSEFSNLRCYPASDNKHHPKSAFLLENTRRCLFVLFSKPALATRLTSSPLSELRQSITRDGCESWLYDILLVPLSICLCRFDWITLQRWMLHIAYILQSKRHRNILKQTLVHSLQQQNQKQKSNKSSQHLLCDEGNNDTSSEILYTFSAFFKSFVITPFSFHNTSSKELSVIFTSHQLFFKMCHPFLFYMFGQSLFSHGFDAWTVLEASCSTILFFQTELSNIINFHAYFRCLFSSPRLVNPLTLTALTESMFNFCQHYDLLHLFLKYLRKRHLGESYEQCLNLHFLLLQHVTHNTSFMNTDKSQSNWSVALLGRLGLKNTLFVSSLAQAAALVLKKKRSNEKTQVPLHSPPLNFKEHHTLDCEMFYYDELGNGLLLLPLNRFLKELSDPLALLGTLQLTPHLSAVNAVYHKCDGASNFESRCTSSSLLDLPSCYTCISLQVFSQVIQCFPLVAMAYERKRYKKQHSQLIPSCLDDPASRENQTQSVHSSSDPHVSKAPSSFIDNHMHTLFTYESLWDLRFLTATKDCTAIDLLRQYLRVPLNDEISIPCLNIPQQCHIDDWLSMYRCNPTTHDDDTNLPPILLKFLGHQFETPSLTLSQLCCPDLLPDELDESYFLSQSRPFTALLHVYYKHEIQHRKKWTVQNTNPSFNITRLGLPQILSPLFLFLLKTCTLKDQIQEIDSSWNFSQNDKDRILKTVTMIAFINSHSDTVIISCILFLNMLHIESRSLKIDIQAFRRIHSQQLKRGKTKIIMQTDPDLCPVKAHQMAAELSKSSSGIASTSFPHSLRSLFLTMSQQQYTQSSSTSQEHFGFSSSTSKAPRVDMGYKRQQNASSVAVKPISKVETMSPSKVKSSSTGGTANANLATLACLRLLEEATQELVSGQAIEGNESSETQADALEPNDSVHDEQSTSSLSWDLVAAFCRVHQLPQSLTVLHGIARAGDWLRFLIDASRQKCPRETILDVVSNNDFFKDSNIRLHLKAALDTVFTHSGFSEDTFTAATVQAFLERHHQSHKGLTTSIVENRRSVHLKKDTFLFTHDILKFLLACKQQAIIHLPIGWRILRWSIQYRAVQAALFVSLYHNEPDVRLSFLAVLYLRLVDTQRKMLTVLDIKTAERHNTIVGQLQQELMSQLFSFGAHHREELSCNFRHGSCWLPRMSHDSQHNSTTMPPSALLRFTPLYTQQNHSGTPREFMDSYWSWNFLVGQAVDVDSLRTYNNPLILDRFVLLACFEASCLGYFDVLESTLEIFFSPTSMDHLVESPHYQELQWWLLFHKHFILADYDLARAIISKIVTARNAFLDDVLQRGESDEASCEYSWFPWIISFGDTICRHLYLTCPSKKLWLLQILHYVNYSPRDSLNYYLFSLILVGTHMNRADAFSSSLSLQHSDIQSLAIYRDILACTNGGAVEALQKLLSLKKFTEARIALELWTFTWSNNYPHYRNLKSYMMLLDKNNIEKRNANISSVLISIWNQLKYLDVPSLTNDGLVLNYEIFLNEIVHAIETLQKHFTSKCAALEISVSNTAENHPHKMPPLYHLEPWILFCNYLNNVALPSCVCEYCLRYIYNLWKTELTAREHAYILSRILLWRVRAGGTRDTNTGLLLVFVLLATVIDGIQMSLDNPESRKAKSLLECWPPDTLLNPEQWPVNDEDDIKAYYNNSSIDALIIAIPEKYDYNPFPIPPILEVSFQIVEESLEDERSRSVYQIFQARLADALRRVLNTTDRQHIDYTFDKHDSFSDPSLLSGSLSETILVSEEEFVLEKNDNSNASVEKSLLKPAIPTVAAVVSSHIERAILALWNLGHVQTARAFEDRFVRYSSPQLLCVSRIVELLYQAASITTARHTFNIAKFKDNDNDPGLTPPPNFNIKELTALTNVAMSTLPEGLSCPSNIQSPIILLQTIEHGLATALKALAAVSTRDEYSSSTFQQSSTTATHVDDYEASIELFFKKKNYPIFVSEFLSFDNTQQTRVFFHPSSLLTGSLQHSLSLYSRRVLALWTAASLFRCPFQDITQLGSSSTVTLLCISKLITYIRDRFLDLYKSEEGFNEIQKKKKSTIKCTFPLCSILAIPGDSTILKELIGACIILSTIISTSKVVYDKEGRNTIISQLLTTINFISKSTVFDFTLLAACQIVCFTLTMLLSCLPQLLLREFLDQLYENFVSLVNMSVQITQAPPLTDDETSTRGCLNEQRLRSDRNKERRKTASFYLLALFASLTVTNAADVATITRVKFYRTFLDFLQTPSVLSFFIAPDGCALFAVLMSIVEDDDDGNPISYFLPIKRLAQNYDNSKTTQPIDCCSTWSQGVLAMNLFPSLHYTKPPSDSSSALFIISRLLELQLLDNFLQAFNLYYSQTPDQLGLILTDFSNPKLILTTNTVFSLKYGQPDIVFFMLNVFLPKPALALWDKVCLYSSSLLFQGYFQLQNLSKVPKQLQEQNKTMSLFVQISKHLSKGYELGVYILYKVLQLLDSLQDIYEDLFISGTLKPVLCSLMQGLSASTKEIQSSEKYHNRFLKNAAVRLTGLLALELKYVTKILCKTTKLSKPFCHTLYGKSEDFQSLLYLNDTQLTLRVMKNSDLFESLIILSAYKTFHRIHDIYKSLDCAVLYQCIGLSNMEFAKEYFAIIEKEQFSSHLLDRCVILQEHVMEQLPENTFTTQFSAQFNGDAMIDNLVIQELQAVMKVYNTNEILNHWGKFLNIVCPNIVRRYEILSTIFKISLKYQTGQLQDSQHYVFQSILQQCEISLDETNLYVPLAFNYESLEKKMAFETAQIAQ